MSGPVLQTLSYGLLGVFAVVFVLRCVRIARMPMHLRWELAPVPKEKTRGRYGGSYLEEHEWWKAPREESHVAEMSYVLQEVLFLKALWEHNRPLWWFSFPFHMGMYILTLGFALLVAGGVTGALGIPWPGWGLLETVFPLLAGVGYGLGAIGALGLVASRFLDRKLRVITTRVAILNLLVLLAVFVTGGLAVLTVPDFPARLHNYAESLLTAATPAEMPGVLGAHLVVSLLFLAYLPFTQMMHFVAKYFTYHQVRWDDAPLVVGGEVERKANALLGQSPTWAAPHIRGDGKKTWVDIATEEVKE